MAHTPENCPIVERTTVLHIRLGTVLKLYQILLAKTQPKDKPGTSTARIEQKQKWEKMSADLLELEVEIVNTGSVFIDFQNLIDRLKAALSEDWQAMTLPKAQTTAPKRN